jgi:hypothetical protein
MELTKAWSLKISKEEIETTGILLDEIILKNPTKQDSNLILRIYYLKIKDIFATIDNSGYYNIVTIDETVQNYRLTYLNQEVNTSSKDSFVEKDNLDFTPFQSEITSDYIKKYGRFLEHVYESDVYYLEDFDLFVKINSDNGAYDRVVDDKHLFRKKYNIPFQDERLQYIFN